MGGRALCFNLFDLKTVFLICPGNKTQANSSDYLFESFCPIRSYIIFFVTFFLIIFFTFQGNVIEEHS